MHSWITWRFSLLHRRKVHLSHARAESWSANIGHLSLDMHWRFVFILVGDVTHSRIWNDSLCASERAAQRAGERLAIPVCCLKVASRGAGRLMLGCCVRGERCIPYMRAVCIKSALLPAASCNERIFPWLCADSTCIFRDPARERERERDDAVFWIWFCKLAADLCLLLLDIN